MMSDCKLAAGTLLQRICPSCCDFMLHSTLVSIPIVSGVQVRVLLKEPKGRDVDDSDSFSFNAGFSEKLFRIKINSIQMKETEEENKKTNDQVSLLLGLGIFRDNNTVTLLTNMCCYSTIGNACLVATPVHSSHCPVRLQVVFYYQFFRKLGGTPLRVLCDWCV